jgi:hypothetical protein
VPTLRLDTDCANVTHTVHAGYMRAHTETTVRVTPSQNNLFHHICLVVRAVFIIVNVLLLFYYYYYYYYYSVMSQNLALQQGASRL